MRLLLLLFCLFVGFVATAQIQTINNGEGGLQVRNKLNENFSYLDTMGVQRLDSLIIAGVGSTVVAGGGLTMFNDTIQWGGAIDSSFNTYLSNLNTNYTLGVNQVNDTQGNSSIILGKTISTGRHSILMQSTIGDLSPTENIQFKLFKQSGTLQAQFIDNRILKEGIEYANSGYVTQTNSLTDKDYVDNHFWKTTGTTDVTNPTISGYTKLTSDASTAPLNITIPVGPASVAKGDLWYNDFKSEYQVYTGSGVTNLLRTNVASANRIPIFISTLGYVSASDDFTFNDATNVLSVAGFPALTENTGLKTSGNSTVSSGSSITLPSNDPNAFQFTWHDNANADDYFVKFSTTEHDGEGGIGPSLTFGSEGGGGFGGGGPPLLLKSATQPETSSEFDDLTYVTKKYVDDHEVNFDNGIIDNTGLSTYGLATTGNTVNRGVSLIPTTNGTLNFLVGSSTGNAYQVIYFRSSLQEIHWLPSGMFQIFGSTSATPFTVKHDASLNITSDAGGFHMVDVNNNLDLTSFIKGTGFFTSSGSTVNDMSFFRVSRTQANLQVAGKVIYDFDGTETGELKTVVVGSATLDFPNTGSTVQTQIIPVTGAEDGDPVSLGVPAAAIGDRIIYMAYVSAPNTVTVRAVNFGGGSFDPPSSLFKVTVHKQ